MSTGLPKRIDPQRLADQGRVLAGEFDPAALPRLRELLIESSPQPARFEMRARRDEARRLLLEGEVEATLICTCQRCMEPVTLAVNGAFHLGVVSDEDAAANLPSELDPLLLDDDGETPLATVLEDELLLALPVIAKHADITECGERARLGRETEEKEFDAAAKRENPFAVLKKLKQDNPD